MGDWADRLRAGFERSGWSKMELHRRSGVSYDNIAKYLDGKVEKPRGDQIEQLARALDLDPIWVETGIKPAGEVELKGYVGAGQAVFPIDDNGDDTVEAPAGVTDNTVAVRVQGDSMYPAYEDGSLLYYSRQLPPSEMVNRRCVVKLADGRLFVKVLRLGSQRNLWTLQSINVSTPDMIDQIVEWAAPIDWTKPRY